MTNASLANLKIAHSALKTLYAWDLGEAADMLVQEAFNTITSVLVEETGLSPFPDLGNTPTRNQPDASGGMSNERRADRILREGRATNRAGGNSDERVVGWVVPTDVAGLSDALFALELIQSRALKSALSAKPAQGGERMKCPDCNGGRVESGDHFIACRRCGGYGSVYSISQPIPTPDEAKEEIRARVIVALDKMIGSGETPSILTGRGRAQIAAACVNAIEDALAAPSPTLDEAGLLPCPFCGSAGKLLALRSGGWRVSCSVFECVIGELDNDFEKRSQAIAGWNVRFAALSRARPEEAIREAALEKAALWFKSYDNGSVPGKDIPPAFDMYAEFACHISAHSPAPRVDDAKDSA